MLPRTTFSTDTVDMAKPKKKLAKPKKPAKKKTTREDMNQAAARIVREATRS
jgi:hypothetical protein